jgi:hypothetical protein
MLYNTHHTTNDPYNDYKGLKSIIIMIWRIKHPSSSSRGESKLPWPLLGLMNLGKRGGDEHSPRASPEDGRSSGELGRGLSKRREEMELLFFFQNDERKEMKRREKGESLE